ncbi:MAG: hypothetical protein ACKOWO_05485 [Sediminibacterium sp.]
MNKTNKTKFYLLTTWIIFSRSFDAYCTNLHTPDLSKEANPLVSFLGLTWSPLLLILGGLMFFVIYGFYLSVFKPIALAPEEKGFTFEEFSTFRYLGKKANWTALLFQFPKSPARFSRVMGELLAPCLAYAGVVSTVMWLLIFNSAWYRSVHQAALVYTLLAIGCAIIAYLQYKNYYRHYVVSV